MNGGKQDTAFTELVSKVPKYTSFFLQRSTRPVAAPAGTLATSPPLHHFPAGCYRAVGTRTSPALSLLCGRQQLPVTRDFLPMLSASVLAGFLPATPLLLLRLG